MNPHALLSCICPLQALVVRTDADTLEISLSTKRLELPEADMLTNKQLVFEKAEKTGKKVCCG